MVYVGSIPTAARFPNGSGSERETMDNERLTAIFQKWEAAAKSYTAEYADTGTPWHKLFTVETRREVAQNLLDTFDPAEGE